MRGYTLNISQKESIEGVYFTTSTFFNCVQDINDIWFLLLSTQDEQQIKSSEFSWILDLPQAEYTPPPSPPFSNETN